MMETRILGKTGLDVGVIGMGVEHLNLSEKNVMETFEVAAESGVNCIDLVFNDPLESDAEHWKVIGPVIRKFRNSLVLCLHWGGVFHEAIDSCKRSFDAALEVIGNAEIAMVPLVDSENTWNGWAQESLERLAEYQRDGRVGYIGLSGHVADVAITAVKSGVIDVLMFPINLYQYPGDNKSGVLLTLCRELEVGVIAMKPYYGGKLISTYGKPTEISPAECLHYVLSLPVTTVVPGVQNVEHLREAVESQMLSSKPDLSMTVGDELAAKLKGQCVQCRHCLPCPEDILIHNVILNADYLDYYSGTDWSKNFNRELYGKLKVKASACTECGICLDRCPFGVDVIGKMQRAVEIFEVS